jgi:RNA polymerase sigma factor (sigma-70 family)
MAKESASPLTSLLRQSAGAPAERDLADQALLERFVTGGDEKAFAILVQRHGPMVLGVCRRVLHDAHEAEDAFQATFLVLVHKARSIGRPDSLGPWLHGVAYRTSARAWEAARRRGRERERTAMPDGDPAIEVMGRELCHLLDEELGRLASKYRGPLVLTYLEGKTTEEVARLLGCPKGTVQSRLARGRDRLRDRLVRRGVVLSVSTLSMLLADKAVPASVAEGAVKAAVSTAAGHTVSGAIPETVAALTKGVLRAMFLSKVKGVAAGLLGLCVALAILLGGTRWALADKEAAKDEEKILGTWDLVSIMEGGQKAPPEAIKEAKVTFAADGKMTVQQGLREQEFTYKLDPARTPKEFSGTNAKDRTVLGIYKLDEDTLTACYSRTGDRPTEFASPEGTTIVLEVLKREKK